MVSKTIKQAHSTLEQWNPQLDKLVEEILTKAGVPGAAITVVQGEESAIKTYGVRSAHAAAPVTPETAFDLGSCSKSFVASAVALLVSDGKIGFDDPARRYIPEINLDEPWITDRISIRDLLCNRTGLKRQLPVESFANTDIRIPDILQRIGKLDRVHPFRSGYVYFNPGFMACSLIVERVSGMPYAAFLERRLFQPLGMNHSASGLCAPDKLANRAQGHSERDGKPLPLDIPIFDNWQGAGGIYASAADAVPWLRFHLNGGCFRDRQLIKPAALRQIYHPHTIMPRSECKLIHCPPEANFCHYALGWWSTELQGQRLIQHAGENCGFRAHTAILPDSDTGVCVMLNMAKGRHQVLAYTILETLLTGQSRHWDDVALTDENQIANTTALLLEEHFPFNAQQEPSIELSAYAGIYSHPACGRVAVLADGNKLALQLLDGRLWDMRLTHLGGDTFESVFVQPAVQDYMPIPGRVAFTVHQGIATQLRTLDTLYQRDEGQQK